MRNFQWFLIKKNWNHRLTVISKFILFKDGIILANKASRGRGRPEKRKSNNPRGRRVRDETNDAASNERRNYAKTPPSERQISVSNVFHIPYFSKRSQSTICFFSSPRNILT